MALIPIRIFNLVIYDWEKVDFFLGGGPQEGKVQLRVVCINLYC